MGKNQLQVDELENGKPILRKELIYKPEKPKQRMSQLNFN